MKVFQHVDDRPGHTVGSLFLRLAAQEHPALPVDQSDKADFSYLPRAVSASRSPRHRLLP